MNPARGEAAIRIGGVDLTIAVTFSGLSLLSQMAKTDSMDALVQRLLGFEPFTVACAIKALAIDPAGPAEAARKAELALKAVSAADEAEWREKVSAALFGHVEAGRRLRGEEALSEQVARAAADAGDDAPGERERPSA